MTHSSIVEENQNNCPRKNCRTSHLLRHVRGLGGGLGKVQEAVGGGAGGEEAFEEGSPEVRSFIFLSS